VLLTLRCDIVERRFGDP